MPVLESPEVIHKPDFSDLTTYHQKVLVKLPELDMEEATDFSGHLGFNPVVNSVTVNILPLNTTNNIAVSLNIILREAWAGKDKALHQIRQDLNIEVTQHTIPSLKDTTQILVVSGTDNILRLADYLRQTFEKSTRDDGAVYYRPIIHPALLGTITDTIEQKIAEGTPTKDPDHPWGRAFLEYGWR